MKLQAGYRLRNDSEYLLTLRELWVIAATRRRAIYTDYSRFCSPHSSPDPLVRREPRISVKNQHA
jgi:hypothetical protein